MQRLKTEPDETPKSIYNPTKRDFETMFDMKPYTIPSQEIVTYPTWLADHIAKQLADSIVWERGIKTNYEDDFTKVMEEIAVNI